MIKVISLKDKKIKLVILMMGLILLMICTSSFFDKVLHRVADKVSNFTLKACVDINLPSIQIGEKERNESKERLGVKDVINLEIGMLNSVKKDEEKSENEGKEESEESQINNVDVAEEPINEKVESIQLAEENAVVQEVQEKNIPINYNAGYGNVKIKNQSGYDLTETMLIPNYQLTNNKNIIIFHTHTCESYTPTDLNPYNMTGNYRTTDLNYSVARVGSELKTYLSNYGYNVIHDTTFHDYPAYNGSYGRSLTTVENLLNQNLDTQIVIDIHRDAVGASNEYAPSVMINGESVAQMMLVIGTDASGLEHPDWQCNLKTAVRIQQKAEELYPGLLRPLLVSSSRYNQNLRPGAFIVEVGATGNTLEQSILGMKYFSKILSEAL